ncbi:MAG TPA: SGNH/GDSL hydrolase N-terminal domain-containing protein [Ginsengibacter sp.]|nr:SGNH/GDSL hydrolase N-terminal domain-containing protein [Ginsengibacter sp.]
MKYWIFFVVLLISNQLAAQEVRFKYYTPQQDPAFVIEGQAWPEETAGFFDRLPARAEKIVRKPVWNLSRQSAGLQIRFMSDASDIVVRYTVGGGLQMPHMPATGVSGVDLYAKDAAGRWPNIRLRILLYIGIATCHLSGVNTCYTYRYIIQ